MKHTRIMDMERSTLRFENAIKTEMTLKNYHYQLEKFKVFVKIPSDNGLAIKELLEGISERLSITFEKD